jgi:DNA-binding Lrp family transcriptional regulator
MDGTDNALIGLLRKHARRPVATRARMLGEPGVAALHDTNGRWDLMAELRAESNAELAAVLERVRRVKGIAATEASILLATFR